MSGYALNLIQHPTGTWGFVGNVPVRLVYKHTSGRELTEAEVSKVRYCSCPSMCGYKERSWPSRGEAEQALFDLCGETLAADRIHNMG